MSLNSTPFWQRNQSKGKRKRKKSTFEKQVNRLDAYFSLFIRLSSMDDIGLCICMSCGGKFAWDGGKTAAGHFVIKSPRTLRTRWDERNVNPQCFVCNSIKEGNRYEYGLRLIKKYGPNIITDLKIKSTKSFNPDLFDMEGKITYYREKVKELKKKHGIKPKPKKKKETAVKKAVA